jgi:hypothetical protein
MLVFGYDFIEQRLRNHKIKVMIVPKLLLNRTNVIVMLQKLIDGA